MGFIEYFILCHYYLSFKYCCCIIASISLVPDTGKKLFFSMSFASYCCQLVAPVMFSSSLECFLLQNLQFLFIGIWGERGMWALVIYFIFSLFLIHHCTRMSSNTNFSCLLSDFPSHIYFVHLSSFFKRTPRIHLHFLSLHSCSQDSPW